MSWEVNDGRQLTVPPVFFGAVVDENPEAAEAALARVKRCWYADRMRLSVVNAAPVDVHFFWVYMTALL